MTDNVENATFEILKRIQESVALLRQDLQNDISSLRREVRDGFARSDEAARKQRRDVAGILVMMKATAGDFDERVSAVERRMDAMDAPRA